MDREEFLTLIFLWVLMTLILLGMYLRAPTSKADPLDVDSVSMSVAKFRCNREPMTPQYGCGDYTGRTQVQFDLRLFDVGYWNNRVHTEAIQSTVKTVGWHYELGLRMIPYIDTYYEHHSRHVMEGEQPKWVDRYGDVRTNRFPLEDSVGVRLRFYVNPNPRGSLFGGG